MMINLNLDILPPGGSHLKLGVPAPFFTFSPGHLKRPKLVSVVEMMIIVMPITAGANDYDDYNQ